LRALGFGANIRALSDSVHRAWLRRSARDVRLLVESVIVVLAIWLLLRWPIDRAIAQGDATVQWIPYLQIQLSSGFDWTNHLYRFGLIGGSKLHDAAGTLPIVQICAVAGLSATATANAITIFLQTCFAFFGLKASEGLAARQLDAPWRIVVVALSAFAPILGWRLALGHENLVFGLLPWIAGFSLLCAARAHQITPTMLVVAAFAMWNGASVLGYQLGLYAVVFASPLWISLLRERRRANHAALMSITCALLAGVLLALPRLAGMLDHVFGPDFPRTGGDALTYSFGVSSVGDWLASIPWSGPDAAGWTNGTSAHELNYPMGALAVLVVALATRRLAWAWLASVMLAICFASQAPLIADLLRTVIPPLNWFRVPARAVIPSLVVVPWLAIGALAARSEADRSRGWGGIGAAALLIVFGASIPAIAREIAVWLVCVALVFIRRWRADHVPAGLVAIMVAAVAALSVVAFAERIPRDAPSERIEAGPRVLHDSVIAQAPELQNPLNRLEIANPELPYAMSTAFAAQLPSLDGAWYPTRRFLALLSALSGKQVDQTTGVFALLRSREFPTLQQLYNVRYILALDRKALEQLPNPLGPAWFVTDHKLLRSEDTLAQLDLRTTAWVLAADHVDLPAPDTACKKARVLDANVDERGQVARFELTAVEVPCILIVATNYVETLQAKTSVGGAHVFPVDIALTGIIVPAHTEMVELGPRSIIPWWSRVGFFAGLLMIILSVALLFRAKPSHVH
jgi:hypothetical protein